MPSQYEDERTWEGPHQGQYEEVGAEDVIENPEEVLQECLEKFKTPDYIMEPGIFGQLKRYFQAGGSPEQVIEQLSINYSAVAQMANLLAEWLILGGVKVTEVQAMVENHLKDMILKTFDPKKADTIFTEEGETPAWLTEMIEHPTWRSLIYRLAEEYPDCLMLNFTIKLISDAGFQGEITSISTAAQQIEVFSRVLKSAIIGFLNSSDDWQNSVNECAKMVCHGAHTYVYSQVIVQILSQEPRGGAVMKRLSQEITRCAQQSHKPACAHVFSHHDVTLITLALTSGEAWRAARTALAAMLSRGALSPADISLLLDYKPLCITSQHDVTPITLALTSGEAWRAARTALAAMLSRGALNPADISLLFRAYTQPEPPPVHLLRIPQFLELLVDALFKSGSKLNPEHKSKYMYLLAYAASVCETRGPAGGRVKDELKPTMQAIEKVHAMCSSSASSTEIIAELATLYHCIRFPVVGMGVLVWVECVVTERSYFKLCTEHCPVHLALLDEVASCHQLLHHRLLKLLVRLFESPQGELEILVQLELRKMLLDRMVNLLSRGCVMPVLRYVKTCWQRGDTDISLIRYFITEVLDAIAPPYTLEFVQLVLPMVENEEITGTMRAEGENDPVSEFIVHCKAHYDVS